MAGAVKWHKSYVVPSVVLSLTATGFLFWHVVDPAARIDGWAVTLLVVGFLPWLRTIFESIDFPGGGSVRYQKLEAKQEQQDDEIKALQFLVANFLTGDSRRSSGSGGKNTRMVASPTASASDQPVWERCVAARLGSALSCSSRLR